MFTYLTLLNGARAGFSFILLDEGENRIGRGLDCHVVLDDPLSSRVHAIIERRDGSWFIRDAASRNGTFVNGQKADEAQLIDGCVVKTGTTEFVFSQSDTQPLDIAQVSPALEQTIVCDRPVQAGRGVSSPGTDLEDPERARDLLLLYQLSLELLRIDDPDEVVRLVLERLQHRTAASVVGFLWLSDEGELKPKQLFPPDASGKVRLSKSLTEVVCRKRHAVWIDNYSVSQNASTTGTLDHFAEAICVPVVHEGTTLGALHLYLGQGKFTQSEFDISISVANMLVVALVRARQQALLATNHSRLMAKSADFDELIGESPPMQRLKTKISRVARATGCVLIRGESGAGKELVARAVHKASTRADRPMLSVNCAAIPRDLMESQLFGHKRGSFTGADADHLGWFRQAHSGTLFLDEVGELTLEGQAKLLRILEGHPFLPVGATEEVSVDVRVIAATNRDLSEVVREKRFREDLYYRLSVFELYVPPLREREIDVDHLVQFFLDHFKLQHGRPKLVLSDAARTKLLAYAWPGNVRQLRNVIDSAVVMADGEIIEPGDLGLRDAGGDVDFDSLRIDVWERKLIQEAIARTGNNVPEAAKLLGIGRATLYRKLEEYGIQR
ncbi:MAG: sigma 54-interacting transcriptional regulator [Pirellulaceae bacterium]